MNNSLTLPPTGFIRKPVVLSLVPWGNTKLYAEIKAGRFPAPIKLSTRVAAWRIEEVHAWIAKQGTDATDDARGAAEALS
jgi:prophage regulatory protein